MRVTLGVLSTTLILAAPRALRGQATQVGGGASTDSVPRAERPYSLYISSESADLVTRIDVGPDGWRKSREISVKQVPTEINGPHNVTVSPDGRFWYVSVAHGQPRGSVWKFSTATDSLLGKAEVGLFPTTIGLSPDGEWGYVPNSDFHGDRGKVNTVSVVYTPDMRSVAEVAACDMPHGSRWNHAGTKVYIACMMSDELLVMDPTAFSVVRRVRLGSGTMSMAEHEGHAVATDASVKRAPGAGPSTMPGQNPDCLTTYVSVAPDDSRLYLACNHSNVMEVRDARTLDVIARVPAGAVAYNVEPSPDGRLVMVSNKKARSVSVFDANTFKELARIPTSKTVPHGIAFSPDGRYAFVTCESVGSDPGAIDAIDLLTLTRVASLSLPLQPTGVAVRPPSSR